MVNTQFNQILEKYTAQLYDVVAEKILDWSKDYNGVGAVFGATNPDELRLKAPFFAQNYMPLLIPGVGGQGGSATEVVGILDAVGYPLYLARINSSSGITHPWKTSDNAPKDWDVAVVDNLKKLNEEIGYKHSN